MNRFKIAGLYLIFFIFIAILISGCATAPPVRSFVMGVDSISARNASTGKTYIITSAMPSIRDNDLAFQEVARYVENALSLKGYLRTKNMDTADLLIYLSYKIGEPVKSYHTHTQPGMAMPVYGIWMATPSRSQTIEITTYLVTMILEAYNLKDQNNKSQLWMTTTTLGVFNPDLRDILPFMVAASSDYLGENTSKKISVTIQEDDPKYLKIMK